MKAYLCIHRLPRSTWAIHCIRLSLKSTCAPRPCLDRSGESKATEAPGQPTPPHMIHIYTYHSRDAHTYTHIYILTFMCVGVHFPSLDLGLGPAAPIHPPLARAAEALALETLRLGNKGTNQKKKSKSRQLAMNTHKWQTQSQRSVHCSHGVKKSVFNLSLFHCLAPRLDLNISPRRQRMQEALVD